LALLKREEKQKRREKLEHILYLMFEKASPSGRLTSLSRRERGFINEECHGAYERKKLDDRDFQKNYAWYRIAWYGRMKGLWRQSVKRKTDQRVKAMKVTNAVQRKLIA